jgi:pilus assembly protein CpaB
MKRAIPIGAAAVVFVGALFLIRPQPTAQVAVAVTDLTAGHTLALADMTLQEVPRDLVPQDAVADPSIVAGKMLSVDRSAGDLIRTSQLGEPMMIAPDERAVAVHVSDASGLAGLVHPGDVVGIVASIQVQDSGGASGTYTKATIEPLRVLYISPTFAAADAATPEADPVTGLISSQPRRSDEGTVVLAVPTSAQVILYDFASRHAPNTAETVNALELLTALDSASNATLSMYLVPEDRRGFASSGLFLPDLVITPQPTPTETATPEGYVTPTPTATSAEPSPTASP